jgi:hypothetical protein
LDAPGRTISPAEVRQNGGILEAGEPFDAPGRTFSPVDRATPSAVAGDVQIRITLDPINVTPFAETSGVLLQLVVQPVISLDLTINLAPLAAGAEVGASASGVSTSPGVAGAGASRAQLAASVTIMTEQAVASAGTSQGQAAASVNADTARGAATVSASASNTTGNTAGTAATAAVVPTATLPAGGIGGSTAFAAPTASATSPSSPAGAVPASAASKLGSSGATYDTDIPVEGTGSPTRRPAPKAEAPEDKGTDTIDPAVPPPPQKKAEPRPGPTSDGDNEPEEGADRLSVAAVPEVPMAVLVAGEQAPVPAVPPPSGGGAAPAAFPPASRPTDEGTDSQEAQGEVRGRGAPLWMLTGAAAVLAPEVADQRARGGRTQAEVSPGC